MSRTLAARFTLLAALGLAGCGGSDAPETRPLVVLTSVAAGDLEPLARRFTERTGRVLDLERYDAQRGLHRRFDLLLLPSGEAPLASPDAETLAPLHAWPLARAGAGSHHDAGLWVGVARTSGGLLAAAVPASSEVQADARELVAFLLSDEGQARLGEIEGLEALVATGPSEAQES